MLNRTTRYWLLFLVGFSLTVLAAECVFAGHSFAYPAFGNRDFIEYWSAFQLFRSGANPYDASLIKQLETQHGLPASSDPILFWNPPWLLTRRSEDNGDN